LKASTEKTKLFRVVIEAASDYSFDESGISFRCFGFLFSGLAFAYSNRI